MTFINHSLHMIPHAVNNPMVSSDFDWLWKGIGPHWVDHFSSFRYTNKISVVFKWVVSNGWTGSLDWTA